MTILHERFAWDEGEVCVNITIDVCNCRATDHDADNRMD